MNNTVLTPDTELVEGDRVDLENDPYADPKHDHPYFESEYVEIAGAEPETPGCSRVDFEGTASVGFPPEHQVAVRVKEEDEQDVIPAWIGALHSGDEVRWNDPDRGRCNRTYKIRSIEFIGEVVRITDVNGDQLECLASELR